MLQKRSRWRKYVTLLTTGEAHLSDAVGSELTSDALELPGRANLAFPVRLGETYTSDAASAEPPSDAA